ncbi:hypothetical protein HYDPIDRAFT_119583 [Hydnomerulius pinastri MD-312]|uniref:Uncharacterized protein n=1 Tax=Hydnomerulius pinastri MD-312 TaxID=994086 RepID=A0A0C9W7G5_9AGAM|nr:hypothetical protein HYDPIDRAFT_119583 [Hydnomerulius pinastri MD-312]
MTGFRPDRHRWELQGALSGGEGAQRTIAFVKIGGGVLSGDAGATAHMGLWIGETTLSMDASSSSHKIAVTNIREISAHYRPRRRRSGTCVHLAFGTSGLSG